MARESNAAPRRPNRRMLKECVKERDRQHVRLRANAWDIVDGILFLLTLTSLLGAAALLITFADALWHW
jgi:hypothetical protein